MLSSASKVAKSEVARKTLDGEVKDLLIKILVIFPRYEAKIAFSFTYFSGT